MENVRNKNIDIVKSLAIMMVVLGHCGFPLRGIFSLFHVPIFFMASGYCYNSNHSKSIKDILKLVKKRVKQLYVPFILINIMLILFHNFFIKINFYTNNNLFLTLSTGNSYGLSDFYGIRDIIKNIVYVLLFRNEEQLAGATWFLRVIFLINIAYAINSYLINKILKNKKGKNTIYILFLHFLAFKLITYIQLRIYNLPNYSLASFPTLYINNGWWILYFLAGIIIPMIICKTLKYCKERAHEKYSNNK